MTIHKKRPSTLALDRPLEVRRVLADEIAERFHIVHRSFRKNAVAEIEDVAGASAGLAQNVLGPRSKFLPIGEEEHRIEIALHCAFETEASPSLVERNAPVEADDFSATDLHSYHQGRSVGTVVHHGNGRVLEALARMRRIG